MRIFWDCEFTGLHQNTTLISIGFVSEDGQEFYAEMTDYDREQIDDWLKENVLAHLLCPELSYGDLMMPEWAFTGDTAFIKDKLLKWFAQFDQVELWSDCLAYDWVLLSEMIADREKGYPQLPANFAYHSPYDILPLFKMKGVDPDITREKFAFGEYLHEMKEQKHNALWDAKVIKACYEKLTAT